MNYYIISKYIVISLYFPRKDKSSNKIITETAPKKIHIMDNFKVGIFININIITPKGTNLLVFY